MYVSFIQDFRRNLDPPIDRKQQHHGVPEPHLGMLPPPDPPNQLNNPPQHFIPQGGQGVVGSGLNNAIPNYQPPPANAFPQFTGGQQEVCKVVSKFTIDMRQLLTSTLTNILLFKV